MCVTVLPQIPPTAVVIAGAPAYSGASAFAQGLMTAPPQQLHPDLLRSLLNCAAISDRLSWTLPCAPPVALAYYPTVSAIVPLLTYPPVPHRFPAGPIVGAFLFAQALWVRWRCG